jgi:hypothetical protein
LINDGVNCVNKTPLINASEKVFAKSRKRNEIKQKNASEMKILTGFNHLLSIRE